MLNVISQTFLYAKLWSAIPLLGVSNDDVDVLCHTNIAGPLSAN